MNRYTKTFQEQQWYTRDLSAPLSAWERTEPREAPIDDQVRDWVDATGAILLGASPVGIGHFWANPEMTCKLVVLAVTVIYEEPDRDPRNRSGSEVGGRTRLAAGQGGMAGRAPVVLTAAPAGPAHLASDVRAVATPGEGESDAGDGDSGAATTTSRDASGEPRRVQI